MFQHQQLLLLFTEIYKHDQEGSILDKNLHWSLLRSFTHSQNQTLERKTSLVKIHTEITLTQFGFFFFQVNICFCQTLSPFALLCNCSSAVSSTIWQRFIIWHVNLGMSLILDSTSLSVDGDKSTKAVQLWRGWKALPQEPLPPHWLEREPTVTTHLAIVLQLCWADTNSLFTYLK